MKKSNPSDPSIQLIDMLVNNAELDDEFFKDLSQKSLKG